MPATTEEAVISDLPQGITECRSVAEPAPRRLSNHENLTRRLGPLHWKLCKAGSSAATVFREVARVGASIGRSDLQPAKETRHERSYRDDECAGKGIFGDDDDDPGHRPGQVQKRGLP